MPSRSDIPHDMIVGDICAIQTTDSTFVICQTIDGNTWVRTVMSDPWGTDLSDWHTVHTWRINHDAGEHHFVVRADRDDADERGVQIERFFMIPNAHWREFQEYSIRNMEMSNQFEIVDKEDGEDEG